MSMGKREEFTATGNDKKQAGRKPLLRVSEAAALLGVSTPTAYRWIARGRIPAVDTGGKRGLYVPARALAAVLAAEAVAALENLEPSGHRVADEARTNDEGAGAVNKT